MTSNDGPVDPMMPTEVEESTRAEPTTRAGTDAGSRARDATPAGAGYQLGQVIGRGGMGEVLLAHDPQLGRDVALKRMRAAEPSTEMLDRFMREAKIQARLDHPAIVPVHEFGHDAEGRPYFTMKRLAGTTLAALLERRALPPQRLLRAFVDVCLAVELAHTRGVIHRDLKPSNIMLGDFGEVYVLDWGVARLLGDVEDGLPASVDLVSLDGETRTGALLGTPGYMAPEQARGEEVGTAVDIYALGSILFELLAGEPLHPRGAAAIASTLESADRSPTRRDGGRAIAPELDGACVAALDADPAKRPSARELADRIQRYLDGDRDLEHRRELAARHLTDARAALAAGTRAQAVHLAGRAVALDPEAEDAVDLLTSLIVAPPSELPTEARRAFEAEEVEGWRARSRRALVPFVGFFLLCTPALPFLEIGSWSLVLALYGVIGVQTCVSYINWRIRRIPTWLFLLVQLSVALVFSRLASPFVLTPLAIIGFLLSSITIPWFNARRWAVMTWAGVAAVLPLVLEGVGMLAATWHMTPAGLVTAGTVFADRTNANAIAMVVGNIAIIMAVAAYALALARDRRVAQRELYSQAWHLKQLLPRRDGLQVTAA